VYYSLIYSVILVTVIVSELFTVAQRF